MNGFKKYVAIGSAIAAGPLLATTAISIRNAAETEQTDSSNDFSLDSAFVAPTPPPTNGYCWDSSPGVEGGCIVDGGGGGGGWWWWTPGGEDWGGGGGSSGGGGGGGPPPPPPPPTPPPPPAICPGISVNGNNVTIQASVTVKRGNFGSTGEPGNFVLPQPGTVDPAQAQNILNTIMSTWSGQFGSYNVQVNLTLTEGPASMHIWIGQAAAGGTAWAPTGDMWLSTGALNNPVTAPHEFGHLLGNLVHPDDEPGYQWDGPDIMLHGGGGPPLPRHIEQALRSCGLLN